MQGIIDKGEQQYGHAVHSGFQSHASKSPECLKEACGTLARMCAALLWRTLPDNTSLMKRHCLSLILHNIHNLMRCQGACSSRHQALLARRSLPSTRAHTHIPEARQQARVHLLA